MFVMKTLVEEVRAIRNMLEYIMEQVIGIEEPEDWEKKLIDNALKEESLDEEEMWKILNWSNL